MGSSRKETSGIVSKQEEETLKQAESGRNLYVESETCLKRVGRKDRDFRFNREGF